MAKKSNRSKKNQRQKAADSSKVVTKDSSMKVGDGLQNLVTGLGTSRSKITHNQWNFDLLNQWQDLEAAYISSWVARRIVDGKAEDMTREWRAIKSNDAETIRAVEKQISLQHHVQEAIAWSRLYGGAGILMLTGQDLTEPLDVNAVNKGDLTGVMAFDRWDLTAMSINTWDILADNYLQPEFYLLRGGDQKIHHTHVARFIGARLPKRRLAVTQGWGDSDLRRCLCEIEEFISSKSGIAELMQEANIDVMKIDGLSDVLATDEEEHVLKRYELFGLLKSLYKVMLIDGSESLDRMSLNFAGIPGVLEIFMTCVAGCAQSTVTKIFGSSAQGMNATGEGDKKNYYDDIRASQFKLIQPLRAIDEVMVRSALGFMPDDYSYEWNPLEQPDSVESAQAALLRSQKDSILLQEEVIQRSQVQRNLQASDEYQFDDAEIDKLESMEDATMFDEPPETEPPEEPTNTETKTAFGDK